MELQKNIKQRQPYHHQNRNKARLQAKQNKMQQNHTNYPKKRISVKWAEAEGAHQSGLHLVIRGVHIPLFCLFICQWPEKVIIADYFVWTTPFHNHNTVLISHRLFNRTINTILVFGKNKKMLCTYYQWYGVAEPHSENEWNLPISLLYYNDYLLRNYITKLALSDQLMESDCITKIK